MLSGYRPDFLIENTIIVELKAQDFIPKKVVDQMYDYLRNSKYELGYFVNFAAEKLDPKRIIYTNDQKHWLNKPSQWFFVLIFVSISVYYEEINLPYNYHLTFTYHPPISLGLFQKCQY